MKHATLGSVSEKLSEKNPAILRLYLKPISTDPPKGICDLVSGEWNFDMSSPFLDQFIVFFQTASQETHYQQQKLEKPSILLVIFQSAEDCLNWMDSSHTQ